MVEERQPTAVEEAAGKLAVVEAAAGRLAAVPAEVDTLAGVTVGNPEVVAIGSPVEEAVDNLTVAIVMNSQCSAANIQATTAN